MSITEKFTMELAQLMRDAEKWRHFEKFLEFLQGKFGEEYAEYLVRQNADEAVAVGNVPVVVGGGGDDDSGNNVAAAAAAVVPTAVVASGIGRVDGSLDDLEVESEPARKKKKQEDNNKSAVNNSAGQGGRNGSPSGRDGLKINSGGRAPATVTSAGFTKPDAKMLMPPPPARPLVRQRQESPDISEWSSSSKKKTGNGSAGSKTTGSGAGNSATAGAASPTPARIAKKSTFGLQMTAGDFQRRYISSNASAYWDDVTRHSATSDRDRLRGLSTSEISSHLDDDMASVASSSSARRQSTRERRPVDKFGFSVPDTSSPPSPRKKRPSLTSLNGDKERPKCDNCQNTFVDERGLRRHIMQTKCHRKTSE